MYFFLCFLFILVYKMTLLVVACLKKINTEMRIASLEVPAMGIVTQLQLGAMKVMGTHNYYNAAVAALCVLGLDLGVDAEGLSSTIEKLRAPPHRMEIGNPKWIVIYCYLQTTFVPHTLFMFLAVLVT